MNDNQSKSQAAFESLMEAALDTLFLGNITCWHNKKPHRVKDVFKEAARMNSEYSALAIRQQMYIAQLQSDLTIMAVVLNEFRKAPALANAVDHCFSHIQTFNPPSAKN